MRYRRQIYKSRYKWNSEDALFVSAIAITGILLIVTFSMGRGASLGGVVLVGGFILLMLRSILYLIQLALGKVKRGGPGSTGHAFGFMLIQLMSVFPIAGWLSARIADHMDDPLVALAAIGAIGMYLFAGLELFHWLSPDEGATNPRNP
jgi:hypothetical protein